MKKAKKTTVIEVVEVPSEWLDHVALVAKCDAYLDNTNVILWGMAHDVNDHKSRSRAAEWFATQIEAVLELAGDG